MPLQNSAILLGWIFLLLLLEDTKGLVVFSSAVPVLDGPTISGLDFDGSVCEWCTVSESLE